jgi:hypothetical protein
MCSKAHNAPTAPLVLHHTRTDKCAIKKNCINGHLRNKLYFDFHLSFSLVKIIMNAPRICKLPNDLKKIASISSFSIAKGGTKTIAHLSVAEG